MNLFLMAQDPADEPAYGQVRGLPGGKGRDVPPTVFPGNQLKLGAGSRTVQTFQHKEAFPYSSFLHFPLV
jgi:hypothetical protein